MNEKDEGLMHEVFNLSNVFGAIALLIMIVLPATVEGEMYVTSTFLVVMFAGFAYLSMREDGNRK